MVNISVLNMIHLIKSMTKITSGRGTSTTEVDDESSQNWAGKKFKKYQKEKLEEAGDSTISTNRGTGTVSTEDIPETELPEAKKLVTKRGTSTSSDQ